MFEEIFLGKKLSPDKLSAFGFVTIDGGYRYTTAILNGDFILHITLDRHGNPDTSLIEADTGEEYILYKTAAEGAFVGEVRLAASAVLETVAAACFVDAAFRQSQTLALLAYAAETYGNLPDFLWEDTPHNGILRRTDSGKWYAAILTIKKSKLGLSSDQLTEIINLHAEPAYVTELLRDPAVYPAWHMNKKSWYTIILDGSMPDEVLYSLLDESYRRAGKPSKKPRTARNGTGTKP